MRKSNLIHLMVILCLTILGSISSSLNAQNSKQQVLRHVVCFQFKEEVSEERKAQAIQNFLGLKDEIPEIKKFEGGENTSVEGHDKGFSHCYVLTFESEAARDIYLPHPAHKRVAGENKPLLSDLLVVDYWGEE